MVEMIAFAFGTSLRTGGRSIVDGELIDGLPLTGINQLLRSWDTLRCWYAFAVPDRRGRPCQVPRISAELEVGLWFRPVGSRPRAVFRS